MTYRRTLLLSLRPRFAQAILSGAKTVEVRRRPVNAPPQTPIILYASSPTMAIVGTATPSTTGISVCADASAGISALNPAVGIEFAADGSGNSSPTIRASAARGSG